MPRPLSAVLAAALLYAAPGAGVLAQPVFSKSGGGAFSNITTSLLVNDAAGAFMTQGSVPCQAPQTGQLTSPSGVCMQYTPSIAFVGGAAAIFGLKGGIIDYASPPLNVSADAGPGSSAITIANQAATANISTISAIGSVKTLSSLAASVAGALPAGETITAYVVGASGTVLSLSAPTLADLPPGSTVTFSTNTGAQQFTGIASSVDLTAHQGPGSGGQAWGGNFIVEAEAGSNGSIHGIEIDVANFSASVGGFGVWLGNNGNQHMSAGLFIGAGVSGAGWLEGVESVSSINDDVLSISSATTFGNDHGSHSVGTIYQGTYSTAIMQGINPNGLTPTTRALFTVTPKGGLVDSSVTPMAATSGSTQTAVNGSTGMILVCSGTIASLTVVMPALPLPKQRYEIGSECTVTTLSLTLPGGSTVAGGATTIAPATPIGFIYDNDRLLWLRW
ncbi:hypothetical protein [Lichenicoccus sp.]|uniref:hypothetical protein n=1 Tax=Lichenicoccus sp. TaxID=2781899 RepID=UPI003D0F5F83